MSNDIKLSPKHGLNPAILCCFWCGEPKDVIALLGKTDREDSKAPEKLIVDYEPCDKCKELFGDGVQLIGSTTEPSVPNMVPITGTKENPLYPTGTYIITSKEQISNYLHEVGRDDIIEGVLEKRRLVIPEDFAMFLIDKAKEVDGFVKEENGNENN